MMFLGMFLAAILFLCALISVLRSNRRTRQGAASLASAIGVMAGLPAALASAWFETQGEFCEEIGCGFLLMAVLIQWFYWASGTALAAFAVQFYLAGTPE